MRYGFSIFVWIVFLLFACKKGRTTEIKQDESNQEAHHSPRIASPAPKFDPMRGKGMWNEKNLAIGTVLQQPIAIQGEKFYFSECSSCHKLSNQKLNGPGFKGLTERRSPEWIMNFLTQPNQVLNRDSVEMTKLKICPVRLPGQNISDADARALLEFFRKKDGLK